MERAMALLARRLGSIRPSCGLRNYVTAAEMPYTTPPGAVYDSGDYPATLRAALARFDYAGRRREQTAARASGRLLGIGIATSVEPAGTNLASYEIITGRRAASGSAEAAMVRVEPDGRVRAALGDPPSGQGYETVIAQIVADELGLSPEQVDVARGFDSASTPWLYLSGNYSNKFSVTDTGAVVGAARRVRDKLLRIAAHRLEADPADLELRDGAVGVRGVPARALTLRELARTAYADVLGLPPGEEPGLEARHAHQNPLARPMDAERRVPRSSSSPTPPTSVSVEVDPARRRDDPGVRRRARLRTRAQSAHRGGHGARLDGARHRRRAAGGVPLRCRGQLLTSTFMDYLKPTALDIPDIDVGRLEHPSPFTPLGAKGVGEGGAIPGPRPWPTRWRTRWPRTA
jgi:2-furoyl-CoA dehydrogenase large subunit